MDLSNLTSEGEIQVLICCILAVYPDDPKEQVKVDAVLEMLKSKLKPPTT